MGDEPMRVVGYCRVSTAEQASDGVSLLAQADKVRGYCQLYGLDLLCVLSDPGETGKNLDRPALREALGMLDAGQAGGVVILKLDRLTRSVRDLGTLLDRHFGPEAGHQLFSVHDSIDTRTAAGRMILRVLTSVAEWEREAIVERTNEAIAHKRARGERIGTVPFGWEVGADGKQLVLLQEEQDVLDWIRRLRAQGHSFRRIAADLTEARIPTKTGRSEWAAASVASILARDAKGAT